MIKKRISSIQYIINININFKVIFVKLMYNLFASRPNLSNRIIG